MIPLSDSAERKPVLGIDFVQNCGEEAILKAVNIFVTAEEPFEMIKLLDAKSECTRTSSLFEALSKLSCKSQNCSEIVAVWDDAFQWPLRQLERAGPSANPKKFRFPLLLYSLRHKSLLERMVAVFYTRDSKKGALAKHYVCLDCKAVSDLSWIPSSSVQKIRNDQDCLC